MPPTIQTNLNADRDKRTQRTAEKRSELVCKVKYCNTLPDIPFDPKFITYPFESRRFIEYNPTSLERNYKYEVLTEHDLGVTIDLINKDLYAPDYNKSLDPADEKLLEEDVLTPQDSKRSRHHGMSVSWLRRTEYISTEQTRFQPQTMEKVEAKVGYNTRKNFKDETLYMDHESQIKAIEKTFTDSKQPVEKHYSKPNVYPVEVLPVFPDFKLWKYPCAQVIFDSDPAPVGRPVPAQIEEMSNAMIRGVMDESGEQFVAYFLPTDTTLDKRRNDLANNVEYTEDEEYEYKMAREYNWNVKSKASKGYEENYFLVMRQGDGAYYNELETRVRLSKRRQKAGQQVNNTRLVVQHRTLTAQEFKMQRYRERQLEPPNEEEEEEEEEEQNNAKSDDERVDKDKKSGSDREDSDKEKDSGNKGRTEGDKENNDSENERVNGEKEDSDEGSDIKEKIDKSRRSSSVSGSGSDNEAVQKNRGNKTDAASHTSRSRSPSGSPSRSVRRSPSGSPRRSVSESPHNSRSGSPQRSASGSPRRSATGSPRRSVSGSPRRLATGLRRRSATASPRSASGSPRRSASGSPRRSASGSPRCSVPGSPARSVSGSPTATQQSRSRSASPSGSGSGSDSESE